MAQVCAHSCPGSEKRVGGYDWAIPVSMMRLPSRPPRTAVAFRGSPALQGADQAQYEKPGSQHR